MTKQKPKRLHRSTQEKMLGGVCGGMAEYFEVDPTLIRLLWVVGTLLLAGIGGILAYLICWVIVPESSN